MCDFRTYSHELLTEFIEAFRNNPCLWKLRSNDYKDKNLKLQAYNNLLEIIRKVERDATIENVKKKINSLRAGFRKEHKKVQDSKKTGSGTDQVYVPKLWYYSQLEFLKDQGQVERRIEHVICRQGENGGRQERGRGTSNTFSDLRDASLGERKMADTNVIFTSKLLKKFILMYKELPCLWDRKCVTYKHKKNRNEAVSKLTELVQQYDKSATRLHVLRKIESMRACVRRAHRRVMQSRLTATNPDDIYNPNLWYYDMLSFVFDEERDTTTVVKDSPETEIEEADSLEQNEEEEYDGRIEYQEYALTTNVIEENPPIQKFNYDDEKSKRHCTEVDDEYDAIGINVAAKLRGLPANMRIPAEKLINDVLYQAQMNCLTSTTVITTPDPIKHDRGY